MHRTHWRVLVMLNVVLEEVMIQRTVDPKAEIR